MTWSSPATYTERTEAGASPGSVVATKQLSGTSATGTQVFVAGASLWERIGFTVIITEGATPQTVSPTGIASEEAFGTGQLNLKLAAQGFTGGEAFGNLVITTPEALSIQPTGIASGQAFGVLTTKLYLGPSGIATAEAFGSARLAALISPSGIASGEAFGATNVAIEQFITPTGVIPDEAFGTPALQLGYPQDIFPDGIEPAEVVEDLFIRNADRVVLVNPSIQETPAAWDPLNIRYGIHRGITILKDEAGTWRSVRYPSQTELEVAQRFYLGGRRHVLSGDEAGELIDAGYGAYITLEPDI